MNVSKCLIIFFFLLCSGCVSFSNLDPNFKYEKLHNESIIVLGISPRARVQVFDGENEGDKWSRNPIATTLNIFPEGGYVVAKVSSRSAGKNYGIGGILPDGIGGELFIPCKGQKTMVFDALKGKVTYVGSVEYYKSEDKLGYKLSFDFEKAEAYMNRKYPNLASVLIGIEPEIRELNNATCSTAIEVPIFK